MYSLSHSSRMHTMIRKQVREIYPYVDVRISESYCCSEKFGTNDKIGVEVYSCSDEGDEAVDFLDLIEFLIPEDKRCRPRIVR